MKIELLPKKNHYKAGLHTHTTVSDGDLTPAEMKAAYQEKGYQVLGYTDHEVFLDHQDLTDDNFVALNGIEIGIHSYDDHCCHFCALALEPDNLDLPVFSDDAIFFGDGKNYVNQMKLDKAIRPYVRSNTPACITDMMQLFNKAGFFVTYNHPTWSQEGAEQYLNYHGMHAMEMVNYGSLCGGYEEYNPRVYNDMLRAGEKIGCVMADDAHTLDHVGGAWTVISADRLDYRSITDALMKGDYYCTEGPEIKEFYVEDGVAHIVCSPAVTVLAVTNHLHAKRYTAESGSLTEAAFPLNDDDLFVRFVVIDRDGKHACTNAYFPQK